MQVWGQAGPVPRPTPPSPACPEDVQLGQPGGLGQACSSQDLRTDWGRRGPCRGGEKGPRGWCGPSVEPPSVLLGAYCPPSPWAPATADQALGSAPCTGHAARRPSLGDLSLTPAALLTRRPEQGPRPRGQHGAVLVREGRFSTGRPTRSRGAGCQGAALTVRGGGSSPAWPAAPPAFLGAADSSGLPDGLARTSRPAVSSPGPSPTKPSPGPRGPVAQLRGGSLGSMRVGNWSPIPLVGNNGGPADTEPTAWGGDGVRKTLQWLWAEAGRLGHPGLNERVTKQSSPGEGGPGPLQPRPQPTASKGPAGLPLPRVPCGLQLAPAPPGGPGTPTSSQKLSQMPVLLLQTALPPNPPPRREPDWCLKPRGAHGNRSRHQQPPANSTVSYFICKRPSRGRGFTPPHPAQTRPPHPPLPLLSAPA